VPLIGTAHAWLPEAAKKLAPVLTRGTRGVGINQNEMTDRCQDYFQGEIDEKQDVVES
jgi:hypothetical protein